INRVLLFFFFQAEDGIRDLTVTGVQTCALPISPIPPRAVGLTLASGKRIARPLLTAIMISQLPSVSFASSNWSPSLILMALIPRSEERRVGKECRSRRSVDH